MNYEGIDPHGLACLVTTTVALEVIECLPDCDLLEELHHILSIQHDILTHLQNDKHFGSERLDTFMAMLSNLQYETRKLKNANK
jgi:hypothetical protein